MVTERTDVQTEERIFSRHLLPKANSFSIYSLPLPLLVSDIQSESDIRCGLYIIY